MKTSVRKIEKLLERIVLKIYLVAPTKTRISLLWHLASLLSRMAITLNFRIAFEFYTSNKVFASSNKNIKFKKFVNELIIIIQGPIRSKKEWADLKETILHYKLYYCDVNILLSTWKNSNFLEKDFLDEQEIILIELDDPGLSWPSNLTRQIVSTREALKLAERLGFKYAVKTRTDHRILQPRAIEYLFRKREEQSRLIYVSSYGTGKYRPYGLTDQFQFGTISALLVFWNQNNVNAITRTKIPKNSDWQTIRRNSAAVQEIRLVIGYLNSLNHDVNWSWEDYIACVQEFFGILDSRFLQFIQLNRDLTTHDHLGPWVNEDYFLIETHLSENDIYNFSNSLEELPDYETISKALKVPDSELKYINDYWDSIIKKTDS